MVAGDGGASFTETDNDSFGSTATAAEPESSLIIKSSSSNDDHVIHHHSFPVVDFDSFQSSSSSSSSASGPSFITSNNKHSSKKSVNNNNKKRNIPKRIIGHHHGRRKRKKNEEKDNIKSSKCDCLSNQHPVFPITDKTLSSGSLSSPGPHSYYSYDQRLMEPSWIIRFLCYFSYAILILFAYFRMFLEWINYGKYNQIREDLKNNSIGPLYKNSWQAFFTRYIYRRVADIFSIPITGNPGGTVTVLDRKSDDHNFTFHLTGHQYECINLASYDYLGFSRHSSHDPDIERVIRKYGIGVNATHELGQLDLHQELEHMFAKFLMVEACIVFGMGFATNSTNIPSLADDGCLILADERSHASAKSGIHLSKAKFEYFKHNDCDDLERKIRLAILNGNNRTQKPWKKIIIIVEGVYSMEGTIVDLPRLIQLKKRYKCYLYVDEAHSIGAVGPHGRGIVDYFGCDPNDVDLLMGTMTKSFAAAGGYIAGRKTTIDHIRCYSMSNYAGSISAPIIQQIINTVRIIDNQMDVGHYQTGEGRRRIEQLLSNTHYMRDALKRLGFVLAGHYDSPVIPIMIYIPAKIGSIVRMAVHNGLALVCAGYPATSLTTNRIRLCMTAAHNRETLDRAIQILSMIGDVHHIKYQKYGVL